MHCCADLFVSTQIYAQRLVTCCSNVRNTSSFLTRGRLKFWSGQQRQSWAGLEFCEIDRKASSWCFCLGFPCPRKQNSTGSPVSRDHKGLLVPRIPFLSSSQRLWNKSWVRPNNMVPRSRSADQCTHFTCKHTFHTCFVLVST